MIDYGRVVILGRRELVAALNNLPARVVRRIMDDWTLTQARKVRDLARRSAPRDKNPKRNKPQSARLWRSIVASRVKSLRKFPGAISRSIAYSKSSKSRRITGSFKHFSNITRQSQKIRKNSRRTKASTSYNIPQPTARHFHLVVLGTVKRKTKSGANRGAMTPDNFFSQAAGRVLNSAQGEVGASLRDAYQRGVDAEVRRMVRTYR